MFEKKLVIVFVFFTAIFLLGCKNAIDTIDVAVGENINTTNELSKEPIKSDSQTFTLIDIAMHSTKTDCYIAIESKAYDITLFISDHPGGSAILSGCGKDATDLFKKHQQNAKNMLAKYYIGELI